MKRRRISDGIWWMGAVDWDRRLFDALIPLPDGTSYNAYLVEGSDATVLIDTTDPSTAEGFEKQLEGVERVDYLVSNHAEQDHSGCIPLVLEKFPSAQLLCTPKAEDMLVDLLGVSKERIRTVEDGEEIGIGGRTLRFLHMPWVHWPETMVTYLVEDRVLFSCDLFGSHLASGSLFVDDYEASYVAARRYFAEIMMPFSRQISKYLDKVKALSPSLIAPSHGPLHKEPFFILDAYDRWVNGPLADKVVLVYVSMHDSTRLMVEYLASELEELGVGIRRYDLTVSDAGNLAMDLIDAATVVIASPTVLGEPHPHAAAAAFLVNMLRPPLKFAGVIGSYGWGGRAVEVLLDTMPLVKSRCELLPTVLCKGLPDEECRRNLAELARTIAEKHREAGIRKEE